MYLDLIEQVISHLAQCKDIDNVIDKYQLGNIYDDSLNEHYQYFDFKRLVKIKKIAID